MFSTAIGQFAYVLLSCVFVCAMGLTSLTLSFVSRYVYLASGKIATIRRELQTTGIQVIVSLQKRIPAGVIVARVYFYT